jgi:hypothetical protein
MLRGDTSDKNSSIERFQREKEMENHRLQQQGISTETPGTHKLTISNGFLKQIPGLKEKLESIGF